MAALVSPAARRARMLALLVFDAALLGAGGFFIARFLTAPPKAIAAPTPPPPIVKPPPEQPTPTPALPTPMPIKEVPKPLPTPVVHHTHKHPARLRTVPVPKPKTKPQPQPVADPTPLPPPPPPVESPPLQQPPPSTEVEEDNVRFVVQHHLPQVQSCYERALKQDPRLEGVIELQFTLQPDGRATSAHTVANSTGNEGLSVCLARLIESWQFPRPADGPLDFVYPFAFAGGG